MVTIALFTRCGLYWWTARMLVWIDLLSLLLPFALMLLFVGDHLRTTICQEIEILICTFKSDPFYTLHLMGMMTSSNRSIFRVNGPLCGEFTVTVAFPSEKPVPQSFNIFFDLRLEYTVEGTLVKLVIWDAIGLITTSFSGRWLALISKRANVLLFNCTDLK